MNGRRMTPTDAELLQLPGRQCSQDDFCKWVMQHSQKRPALQSFDKRKRFIGGSHIYAPPQFLGLE